MGRSGVRPQVLSLGRHSGSAKFTNGKKGVHLRKTARLHADSGCPVHSDSESQNETVQGLDGCASLLRDILRNEDSGSEVAFSGNRCNSRPLEGKNCGSRKKGREKRVAPSIVRKEILSSSKKQTAPEASSGSERDASDTAQDWSLQDHYRMFSPIIYQALCEHVQTQMSLMRSVPSKNGPNGLPAASGSAQTHGGSQLGSQGQTTSANYPDARNVLAVPPGVACSLPHTDRAAVPMCRHLNLAHWILPQQRVPKEADLLKHFQTHMSVFPPPGKEVFQDSPTQQSPTPSQPAFPVTDGERCAKEQTGESSDEAEHSSVHSQNAVNQVAERVRTLTYLLGELKALGAEQEDSEIQRLTTEVETCVSGLLAVNGHTNTQVEVALAMQPLRSENAHLRRQLRILNRRLREQEETQKAPSNLELFSLQSLNLSLQNQFQESLKSQELLQSRHEELLRVIEDQKDENKQLTSAFKDKDQALLENKQQFDTEMTRVKMELEEALANVKNTQFKLERTEKENQILGITLRQRDAEVSRLRELTRTLQNSMAKLLSDLSMDTARCKPGNSLTKSLLSIHDQQLQQDPTPPHTSIISYLNKLETSHSFIHPEPLSPVKNEAATEPDRAYEDVQPPHVPLRSDAKVRDEGAAPGIFSTLLEQGSDTECETVTLIEDEYNLDNTIYIPFARSASEKHPPLPKRLSPQPQGSAAAVQLGDNRALVSRRENKPCAPDTCSSQSKAEEAPEKLPRARDMEDIELLRRIKEALCRIPAATEDPERDTACHSPPPRPVPGVQVKGSAGSFLHSDLMSDWSISSFSTFTSRDEQDFRNGLAALDANIARLQKSLNSGLLEK